MPIAVRGVDGDLICDDVCRALGLPVGSRWGPPPAARLSPTDAQPGELGSEREREIPRGPPDGGGGGVRSAAGLARDATYLQKILDLLEGEKGRDEARASDIEAASGQLESLKRLREVAAARLSSDGSLRSFAQVDGASGGKAGVKFDERVDEDELRLFQEVDGDGDGIIERGELLASPPLQKRENAEMAKVLRRAVECDLTALGDALEALDGGDFGGYWKKSRKDSVKAVFDAACGGAGQRGGEETFVDRSQLQGLVRKITADSEPEKLRRAVEELTQSLPEHGTLSFLTLKAAVRRVPRVSAQRTAWARSLGLDAALARHLPPGTLDDGLEGLLGMTAEELVRAADAFCADARLMFLAAANEARESKGSKSAAEANSKF